jgi:hypothetical protein
MKVGGKLKYDLAPFKVEKAGQAVLAFYKQVIGKKSTP